ncbi:MAG: hypothetical protein HY852_20035 [Bradyrhizobium sp.]|uniref:hypothetical protein n=1 Tax=Bradyrhizobium sp. TaxID=376 RepID=UPI0025BB3E78|nr:hypothetical protein [Bradyrhizobium sp.]MBI5264097.1 hypothetical protein [Bradyrhizobium sp.]
MRALLFCLAALVAALPSSAPAQIKASPKAAPPTTETRYFTSIDGLMEGNADVILKETRQGKTLTAAVLDVCYPLDKGSGRKDRFVANLSVSGQTLTGNTQTLGEKSPVTIKLQRKPTGETFEFRGQITIGRTVTEVASSDNSDLSEREFQENQTIDDGITPSPKDFTEVSPEAIGVRIKLEAATELLKSLKGQDVEVSLSSLPITCDELRAGEQTINLTTDPERAGALIARLKSTPGVVAVGWTAGIVEIDRAIRFPAADWRDGDNVNKDKLASVVSGVLSRTLAASPASSSWNPTTGTLKLTFKRPSQLYPALGLTDTIEVAGLVSTDKPGASDRLMLWIGSPSITTADEGPGPKLNLSDEATGEEEGELPDDNGSVEALARELNGQRWDADKSAWK